MWLERWSNAIARGLEVMADDLKAGKGRFDLGDVTAACALGYLDLRHGDLHWRKGREILTEWYDEISQRESIPITRLAPTVMEISRPMAQNPDVMTAGSAAVAAMVA